MTDAVLTPEQVEAVRDAILYGHDPRQPTVAEYVALADSHEALRAALAHMLTTRAGPRAAGRASDTGPQR